MASERLPGKPLLDVCGKPLIQRVWACATASNAGQVVVATDDDAIRAAVEAFGGQCVMTREDHSSGSDRIAECLDLLGWPDDTIVVNLQGDEPLMPAECLDQVAGLLVRDGGAGVASLYQGIDDPAEVRNPNAVKVVTDTGGRALYFSRSVVPGLRAAQSVEAALATGVRWKRHIGLYAYRAAALRRFTATPPTPLETAERLEQLRFLESGVLIAMAATVKPVPPGVDTPEDLERARLAFR